MRVFVFRLPDATLSLERSENAEPMQAWLSDGYRIGKGVGGPSTTYVFGASGELGMTAEKAIEVGILVIRLPTPRHEGPG